jgi:hypothetical protein
MSSDAESSTAGCEGGLVSSRFDDSTSGQHSDCSAVSSQSLIAPDVSFNDPGIVYQKWYLDAINVGPVWKAGITGTGINIFFNDEDLDISHPDFTNRYRGAGSVGMPTPADDSSNHGTNVVGFAAAGANNNVCGVGVAYNATISFAKFDAATESVMTVGVDNNVNHVHSNSWGIDACSKLDLDDTGSKNYYRGGQACPFLDSTSSPCSTSQTACSGEPVPLKEHPESRAKFPKTDVT